MTIDAHGLPRNTDFDVFINQLPNAPFGVSWYQGGLEPMVPERHTESS
jgi:hypothetical protein